MFSSIVEVLEMLIENGSNQEQKYEAKILLNSIETFDFIFGLYLMKTILGVTNELSQTLQKKDQDIVNAMNLIQTSKERLQTVRDDGWDSCLNQVSSFCVKHRIRVVNMDDMFIPQVATTTVEKVFSAMNTVKTDLRNRMGDEWLNDSLLAYVEKDIFDTIDRETVMQQFQNMKPRRGKL
ncbi:hypothetical protein Q3G72_026227 [Acer saccharum]|nr:hypothetical protein Q3G72_026227 [Acer saccharum]